MIQFILIYIPIKLSFNLKSRIINDFKLKFFFENLPKITFLLDIPITLNTAFFSKGIIISDKIEIWKNYLHFDFFFRYNIIINTINIFITIL